MMAGATVSPSIVRHGMKRSLSALIVPMRASKPSEIISTALWMEERRDLLLVCLKLRERLPDVGVFVRRIFQFNDAQRQAVDENHHVRAPVVLAFDHRELVHHKPVVVVRVGKINQPDDFRADAAVLAAALDGDAVHQQPMKGAVAGDEGRMLREGDFAEGFVQRFGGSLGFSFRNAARNRSSRTTSPNDLRSALGSPGAMCGPKMAA